MVSNAEIMQKVFLVQDLFAPFLNPHQIRTHIKPEHTRMYAYILICMRMYRDKIVNSSTYKYVLVCTRYVLELKDIC